MPTITLNKDVLEKQLGKKLSEEELKDRISMLGTDLEHIEGNEIVVEVFPNRPDMLSEQGFARALSSFIGVKTGLRKYSVKKPSKDYQVKIDKSVNDVRPCTACAIIKGLRLNDEKIRELVQMQEKLHIGFGRNRKKAAIGIYPLEEIKLPIKYLALEPEKISFAPLEAGKEMTAKQILEQHPKGKQFAGLLKGKKRYPVFMDSAEEILSMPPVINSHKTGKISPKTREVFVECSGFDKKTVGKCLNIIASAMSDMGGELHAMELIYPGNKIITPYFEPEQWELDHEYINQLLGLSLKKQEIIKLLEKMGYGYDSKKNKLLVPAYRTDLLHQADFAEDAAIAYGFEKLSHEIPQVSTIGKEDGFEVFKSRVNRILAGLGLQETMSYHITSRQAHNQKMLYKADVVELANALTTDYSVLRTWIIPSLLEVLSRNTSREYPQNIFETGAVFKKNKDTETGVQEDCRTAVALCGKNTDYTQAKQILDSLMQALDSEYEVKETEHPSFIPGRVARARCRGKGIAYIGEIHPQVLENFGIDMPVSGFELNLTELYRILNV